MTAAELIKQLQEMPPDTRVIVSNEYGLSEANGLQWRWVMLRESEFHGYCERDAEGAVEVVELV